MNVPVRLAQQLAVCDHDDIGITFMTGTALLETLSKDNHALGVNPVIIVDEFDAILLSLSKEAT